MKGKITSDNNIFIEADTFTYNKITNVLDANGNVEIFDNEKKLEYLVIVLRTKNEERIITNGNSRAINNKGIIINAEIFDYKKRKYTEC